MALAAVALGLGIARAVQILYTWLVVILQHLLTAGVCGESFSLKVIAVFTSAGATSEGLDLLSCLLVLGSEVMSWLVATGDKDVPDSGQGEDRAPLLAGWLGDCIGRG